MAIPLRSGPVRQRRETPPALSVVPARRQLARFVVGLTVLLGGVMIGAVLLHTRIAERQLTIDELERSVRNEQEQFDVLRSARAELRSPTRLATEAVALGMVTGAESDFVSVDPMLLAITIAATGEVPVGDELVAGSDARMAPLDQFRLVKSLSSEAP
jgi:cell division protein FtsL